MKKHLTPFRIVAGLLALLVLTFGGIVAAGWLLPVPAIVVSEETTYYTAPLNATGLVDHREAFFREHFSDLAPEDNGAYDYARAMPRMTPEIDKVLGRVLEFCETDESCFQSLDDFAAGHPELMAATREVQAAEVGSQDDDLLFAWSELALRRPWSADEFPILAAWIESQSVPLAHCERGSHKLTAITPSLEVDGELPVVGDGESWMYDADHWLAEAARRAAEPLAVRAMLRLGTGDYDAAANDIDTLRRVSRQISSHGQGGSFNWHVSVEGEELALHAIAVMVHHLPLSAELLRQLKHEFATYSDLPDWSAAMGAGGRFAMLEIMQRRPKDEKRTPFSYDVPLHAIDWNHIMRRYNRSLDEFLADYNNAPTLERRQEAIDDCCDAVSEELRSYHSTYGRVQYYVSRAARSEIAAGILLGSECYQIHRLRERQSRARVWREFVHLAIVLAEYRSDHGEYPPALGALVPEYLSTLPSEPVVPGGDIQYRRIGDGYRLLSFGENGGDNGGSVPEYYWGAWDVRDDVVLRMPALPPPQ